MRSATKWGGTATVAVATGFVVGFTAVVCALETATEATKARRIPGTANLTTRRAIILRFMQPSFQWNWVNLILARDVRENARGAWLGFSLDPQAHGADPQSGLEVELGAGLFGSGVGGALGGFEHHLDLGEL